MFTILPQSNVHDYVGEKKQISDIWRKNYIDALNNEQKKN